MKKFLRIFLVAATAVSLLLGSQLTAFALGSRSDAGLLGQIRQAGQQQRFSSPCRAGTQRFQPPQASSQAQEQARQTQESVLQSGLVAPDIRHQGPSTTRDSSLASTTYNGITISLYDSKTSEETLSEMTEALEDIPNLLLDKFSGTIYVVSDIRNVAANASADAIGMFVTTGDIYMEEWEGHEETYFYTLAHELGHNLDWKLGLAVGYNTFLTASDSDWIDLWEDFPSYQSEEGSLYSTVSIQEWFAEVVADYVCYPDYEEEYYPEIYVAVDDLFN